jgi:hypothetical protein
VYSIWISPKPASSGTSGFPSLFSRVSSVSARDAEGSEHCRSGVLRAAVVDEAEDEVSENTATVNLETLVQASWDIWDYYPQLSKYQYIWSFSFWIQGILLFFDLVYDVTMLPIVIY